MTNTGANMLVKALRACGADHVFSLPGRQLHPVYDILHTDRSIQLVVPRNEVCAGYAAIGYAMASGKPGVCLTIPGPGATNLATPVARAFSDSVPMIAITTQIDPSFFGRCSAHECDLATLFRPIVKCSLTVERPEQIMPAVREAFRVATDGWPGPVHIMVLSQVLLKTVSGEAEADTESTAKTPADLDAVAAARLHEVADLLNRAANPVIFADFGVIDAGATRELRAVAEKLSAPVITSISSRGILPEDHPLCFGPVYFEGTARLLQEADACLAVGARFSQMSTFAWTCRFPTLLAQIDASAEKIGKGYPATLGVVANPKQALERLLPLIARGPGNRTVNSVLADIKATSQHSLEELLGGQPSIPINPLRVVAEIRQCFPAETLFVVEGSATALWTIDRALAIVEPRTFLMSEAYAECGSGLQVAIGAALAQPNRPVVYVAGDASLTSQAGELATAVALRLPITAVVFNDGYFNAPRQAQKRLFGGRYTGVALNNPDFVELAHSFGAKGSRLRDPHELGRLLKEALAARTTTIVDIPIDADAVPPGLLSLQDGASGMLA